MRYMVLFVHDILSEDGRIDRQANKSQAEKTFKIESIKVVEHR